MLFFATSNASANHTLNFSGSATTSMNTLLATGDSVTVLWLNTNGGTAYYPNVYQVDGTTSGVSVKWSGGTAPSSGNASAIDAYSFTIVKTADATFTGFYTANTSNTVAITNLLSGTVTIPAGLTSRPLLTLYRVVGGNDVLVDYKTVSTTGTYSFTLPYQNTTYKLVPSLTIQGVTSADFDLVWGEIKNESTPPITTQGLVMTGTKQWKAADVNKNGIIDLGDAYLIAAHVIGYKLISTVLWFNPTDYDNITKSNFATTTSVTSFTINVTTSDVTQNIKYCILGDVNLSHSSN